MTFAEEISQLKKEIIVPEKLDEEVALIIEEFKKTVRQVITEQPGNQTIELEFDPGYFEANYFKWVQLNNSFRDLGIPFSVKEEINQLIYTFNLSSL